jgi:hypothetical protein
LECQTSDLKRLQTGNTSIYPLGEYFRRENQIGCIYSAQGFEFDRVGVIWGPDLVWRKDKWISQPDNSFDSPVKSKKVDTLRLVRNAYRVLLTRGIKETQLLCLDDETREHIRHDFEFLTESK